MECEKHIHCKTCVKKLFETAINDPSKIPVVSLKEIIYRNRNVNIVFQNRISSKSLIQEII